MEEFFYLTRDFFFDESKTLEKNVVDVVCTDLQLDMPELPPAKCSLANGKFALANKHSLIVHTTIINPGFKGRVKIVMQNFSNEDYDLKKGTKIAKLMFVNTQQYLNERLFGG